MSNGTPMPATIEELLYELNKRAIEEELRHPFYGLVKVEEPDD